MLDTMQWRLQGRIPAANRDWLAWSLVLALLLHVAAVVIVWLLRLLAWWMTVLGIVAAPPPPAPVTPAEERMAFVMIDDAVNELLSRQDAEALANVSREARQRETAPESLPEGASFRPDGVEVTLMRQTPGPPSEPSPPPAASPGETAQPPEETVAAPMPAPAPPEETPPPAVAARPAAPEPPAALPPDPAPPEPRETAALPPPDLLPPVDRPRESAKSPEPDTRPDPSAKPPDREPPETEPLSRLIAQRRNDPPAPAPEQPVAPAPQPPSPPMPPTPAAATPARPMPPVRRIGSETSTAQTRSQPAGGGGAPRANVRSRALLAGDDVMRVLQHRYGEYMQEVGRRLDQSMRRQEVLNPRMYATGVIRIRFGIAGDGTLSHHEVIDEPSGMGLERAMSETVLKEAAPFPPQTEEMKRDPLFQRLTLGVYFH